MSLRVATVFSGIGAIEHALERMGVEHEIVFACDNSNIDPFSAPKVPHSADKESLTSREMKARKDLFEFLSELEGIMGLEDNELHCCFEENCSFSNPNIVQLDHIKRWSLQRPTIDYYQCTMAQLKDFLRERALPVSGRKSELVDRVLADDLAKTIHHAPVQNLPRPNSWNNLMIYCPTHNAEIAAGIGVHNRHNHVKDMVNAAISSIEDPLQRKAAVDALYGRSRKSHFVEDSYLANYEVPEGHFHKDVTFLEGTPYRDDVDLFVGGSPCQSFSFVGAQRGFDDARGTLFYDFVRLVDEIRPRMFIWENVKGVYSHDSGKTWGVVSRCFDETGYNWHHAILNSNDYGIPQHRQRVFVVGFRDGGDDFEFPEPVELRTTMQDFLEDSVAGKYFLGTKGVDFVTWDKNHRKQYTQIDGEVMLCQKANQQFNWHGDFVFVEENDGQHQVGEKYFLSQKVERYVLASGTKGFSAKPETDLEVARPILATLFKNHRAGVDNYVTTEGRLRMLTPKECLRLMGFCDSFEQAVSDIQMYRQAGNSIVVDVLIAIMAQAIPVLAAEDATFSSLKERAERIRELFDELPERQIQQSDLERVVAALDPARSSV